MLLQNGSVISKVLNIHSTLVLDKLVGYTPKAEKIIGRDNTRALPSKKLTLEVFLVLKSSRDSYIFLSFDIG